MKLKGNIFSRMLALPALLISFQSNADSYTELRDGILQNITGVRVKTDTLNVLKFGARPDGYCKRGIYLKSNPDRGGFVENVYVRNCSFGRVEDLFYITASYADEGASNNHFTKISDIHVDGLTADAASGAAVVIQGVASLPVENVTFRNLEVGSASSTLAVENARGVTFSDCFIGPRPGVPSQVSAKDKIFKE